MKIRSLVFLCIIAVILLCFCIARTFDKNKSYTMYCKDGKWYLEFYSDAFADDLSEVGSGEQFANISIAREYPRFDSISDMREKIKNGDIPDRQIEALKAHSTSNLLEICDPNDLYDLAVPNKLTYDYIHWYGDAYSFEFDGTDFLGYVVCCDQETFDQQFNEEYVSFLNKNCSVVNDAFVEDRNAREVHYVTHAAELKKVLYNFTTEQSNMYVVESYVLSYFNNDALKIKTSDTVPNSIRIFGSDGENYFYGWFKGFEERPSVEWLSSFGLVPSTTNVAS